VTRALVAPDKFKGTFTAAEVAAAIAEGLSPIDSDLCAVADGGDGTAAVLLAGVGGEWVEAASHDALGRPLRARYALLQSGAAVVEVSAVSGLAALGDTERDPLAATSAGTGELIADAIRREVETVIVACGGSATTDAGIPALERFDPSCARIICLCDVLDPFEGALRYAPQKGAAPVELEALRDRLTAAAEALPRDPRVKGAAAAGGLAGGLWAHGAELVPGARYVLDAVGFDARLVGAELVITGEGCLDETSARGKAVGEVAARARAAGVPVHAIVGSRADQAAVGALGLRSVREATDLERIADAARELAASVLG
jgi:glycerate kinase